jgi:hypothetical protein
MTFIGTPAWPCWQDYRLPMLPPCRAKGERQWPGYAGLRNLQAFAGISRSIRAPLGLWTR